MLGAFYASLNSDLALDYYNSALAVRPDDDEALYGKAIYLQNQKRYEEAMELYEYMVSVDDQNTLAWYNQGYIALEINNDPETATAYFERAIELFPEYIDAIYNLGLCYERTGDFDTAQVYYKQALEINPQYDLAALGMERLNR
jgi:tetratricopeptide (TPR) repeat protein